MSLCTFDAKTKPHFITCKMYLLIHLNIYLECCCSSLRISLSLEFSKHYNWTKRVCHLQQKLSRVMPRDSTCWRGFWMLSNRLAFFTRFSKPNKQKSEYVYYIKPPPLFFFTFNDNSISLSLFHFNNRLQILVPVCLKQNNRGSKTSLICCWIYV